MSRLEISIWINVQPDLKKLFILSKVKTGRISRWRSVLKEFPETPPDCCGAGISWQGWGGAREQPPSPCPAEEEEEKEEEEEDDEEKYGMTRTEEGVEFNLRLHLRLAFWRSGWWRGWVRWKRS